MMHYSAKQGYRWQMSSALYLLVFTPYMALMIGFYSFHQLTDLISFSRQLHIFIPTLLAVILSLIHAWVGLRDVLIDYAPRRWLAACLLFLHLGVLSLFAWLAYLSLRLFGGL